MNDKIKTLMTNRLGGKGSVRRKKANRRNMLKNKPKQISFLEKQYNLIVNRINKFMIVNKLNKNKIKPFLVNEFESLFQNNIKRKDYQKKKVIQNTNTFIKAYLIHNYFDNATFETDNSNVDNVLNKNYLLLNKYFNDQGIERINDFLFELWDKINQLNINDYLQ